MMTNEPISATALVFAEQRILERLAGRTAGVPTHELVELGLEHIVRAALERLFAARRVRLDRSSPVEAWLVARRPETQERRGERAAA